MGALPSLSGDAATTVALVVNELVTNSLKHAFRERSAGHVRVTLDSTAADCTIIRVDDDGIPFAVPIEAASRERGGLGLPLARTMLESHGGSLIVPTDGSKCFELRLPR